MSVRTYPGYNGGFAIGSTYTYQKWIQYEDTIVESLIDEESRNFPAGFSSTLPGIYFETLIFDDCSAWLDSLVNTDNYYEVQPYQGYSFDSRRIEMPLDDGFIEVQLFVNRYEIWYAPDYVSPRVVVGVIPLAVSLLLLLFLLLLVSVSSSGVSSAVSSSGSGSNGGREA